MAQYRGLLLIVRDLWLTMPNRSLFFKKEGERCAPLKSNFQALLVTARLVACGLKALKADHGPPLIRLV